jgi:nucleoside 2-deoxyribosyltransferase
MSYNIYLANGLGFSELGRKSLKYLKNMLKKMAKIIDPFEYNSDIGLKIEEIEADETKPLHLVKSSLRKLNYEIGIRNKDLIIKSDLVLAILDGNDLDSGTSAEIGFAYGIGKKIIGYRGDFRKSGDNFGSSFNIQVEFFIRSSGGEIFRSIERLIEYFKSLEDISKEDII